MPDFDVIVTGGGPAGAVSALKCAELGLDVLLLEREIRGRHKPCGGILPLACVDVVSDALNNGIPRKVMCSPNALGLSYVPPSGRKNSGSVRNYGLLNINRDLFDGWLLEQAEKSGAEIWDETDFLRIQRLKPIQISAKRRESTTTVTARYLIGADGVYSRTRKQLYPKMRVSTLTILQDYCYAKGDFEDCFYSFFRGEISPAYAYIIPKDGLYVVGVGVPETHPAPISAYVGRFEDWLREEFAFKLQSLERREIWAIPYGFTLNGKGNVILVGDAAGFCNAFSGEGIRLAIESGIAAADSLREAMSGEKPLTMIYADHVESINHFVHRTHDFAINLTDDGREEFVESELARISFK